MTKLHPPMKGIAKDPFIVTDPIAEVETTILKKVQAGGAVPNQKILSRPALAKLLGTSQYRVQRAIARLEQRGLVYGRKGSGVYLTEKALGDREFPVPPLPLTSQAIPESGVTDSFLMMPHVPIFKTLRVQIPCLQGDEFQIRMWRRVFEAFHREHPFVNLEPDFSRDGFGSEDVVISSQSALEDSLPALKALDSRLLALGGFDPDACVDRVLDQGRVASSREFFGLPLLRTTTVLSVNQQLLDRYGVSAEPIAHPVDWFRAGFVLQEKSGGRISSFNYGGFHYHGTFYGIELREEDGRWEFDRARMARFLEDIKPFLRREQLSTKWDINKFFNHSLGICCCYLHAYPWIVKCLDRAADLARLPLEPGGFVTESSFLGIVPTGARSVDEATVLLGYLMSEKGQTVLVEEDPQWLSVNRTVLARQKAASPFPEGSVIYEYPNRNVWGPKTHPTSFYSDHRARMETEAAKFYLGMQSLEETLDKLERGGKSE